jgi:hypothetical protein
MRYNLTSFVIRAIEFYYLIHLLMKQLLTLILILTFFSGVAQHTLPVVHATSNQAKIYEQDNPPSNWTINPKIKTDVHTNGKQTGAKTVSFKTDIDSISFKIGPGQQKDFIVVLNGKDSCLTRIQCPQLKDLSKLPVAFHDTIPFFINKFNTNYLSVVFNNADTVLLNFDTGATEVSFTNDALKNKVKSHFALYDTPYNIRVGQRTLQSKIYDIQLAGNEVDGLLGWDMFDGMIVELDYDRNQMILHSKMPGSIANDRTYSKFKIRYIKNKPFIESEIIQSGVKSKGWFLFDLGYQKTVMLDNDLLRAAGFPADKMAVIKKVMMRGTRGNEVPVNTANLETLKLGGIVLKDIPAQVMEQNKPMRGINIHILGSEVLKKFNTVLDFQKHTIYLKPNHFYNNAYTDGKKNRG